MLIKKYVAFLNLLPIKLVLNDCHDGHFFILFFIAFEFDTVVSMKVKGKEKLA
jgi:hypothetical protein